MTTQNQNVPALRFPTFNEQWEEKSLREITVLITKGTTPNNFSESGINYVKIESLFNDSIDLNKCLYIDEKTHNKELKRSILKQDDLLFAIAGATIGKCGIVSKEILPANTNQALAIIRLRENEDLKFVFLNLQSPKMKRYIKETISVGAQPNLNLEQMGNFSFFHPNYKEQKMIAAFLTAVDEKIQQLTKKKDLLEQYKKGVMQKIFNQEIRFKDNNGNDFADWEEKKFGQVFSFRITNSYSRDNLNYQDGEVKNIHYGDIHTKFKSLFDISKEKVPFINKEISLKKIAEDNYCKVGDLVIADASEDYADVGKCIEITNLENEKVLAGLHTFLARPDLYKMAIGFSGYLMKSKEIRLQIMTIAQGTKVLSISTGRLANVKLNIPSEPEQAKIADFLSVIDYKINSVNQQLEKTKEYKKGLLQQMFI